MRRRVPIVAVSRAVVTWNKARMSLWCSAPRMGAADSALDEGASFAEGQELDAARSARIPPGYVGMMLSRKEAARLLDRIGGKGGRLRG